MKGLPKTCIWVGTWEILYEECIKACDKMKNSGVEVELHIGEKMGHVYPLYPIPEGENARKEIAKFIMNQFKYVEISILEVLFKKLKKFYFILEFIRCDLIYHPINEKWMNATYFPFLEKSEE